MARELKFPYLQDQKLQRAETIVTVDDKTRRCILECIRLMLREPSVREAAVEIDKAHVNTPLQIKKALLRISYYHATRALVFTADLIREDNNHRVSAQWANMFLDEL